MISTHVDEHLNRLPDTAKVCEVGGWSSRRPRADYVIDIMPFDASRIQPGDRVTEDRWIVQDICHGRWPVADDFFDFTICSHVLEDVMNPFHVIRELMRVSPAGYVETPGRIHEAARSPFHVVPGSHHHRWFVELIDGVLHFTPKDGQFIEWESLQIHRRVPLEVGLVGLFWDRANPIKAVEHVVSEDEMIAFRAKAEGVDESRVRAQLRRERLRKRVVYKGLRTLRLR